MCRHEFISAGVTRFNSREMVLEIVIRMVIQGGWGEAIIKLTSRIEPLPSDEGVKGLTLLGLSLISLPSSGGVLAGRSNETC